MLKSLFNKISGPKAFIKTRLRRRCFLVKFAKFLTTPILKNIWERLLLPLGKGRRFTAQKMKFSIEDFFSKCYQIHSFPHIWSHLLEESLMENFIFCAVIELTLDGSTSFDLGSVSRE